MPKIATEEYEFRPSENRIIDYFSQGMFLTAVALVVAGIFTLIQSALNGWAVTFLISGLTWLAMGITLYFPTDNFRRIVETQGNDVGELMKGLGELKIGWTIVLVLLIINRLANLLDVFRVIG